MQFGVPISEYIDIDTDDIELDYRWFTNEHDAVAFAQTDDALPNAVDRIVTMAS